MSKGKLRKFAEMETFNHVLQPAFDEVFENEHRYKGNWNKAFFQNENPITLELGCGKGEYTVGQAKLFPNRNFIGLDIKGARIWKGAKESEDLGLSNVGFIRTRVDFINSFFEKDEVEEIWFTFPDPQLKKPLKRLTSSRFLKSYKKVLCTGGTLNLKTDSVELYDYTCNIAHHNNLEIVRQTNDLYNSDLVDDVLSIQTFYEKGWLKDGLKSHYIQFKLDNRDSFEEPPEA